MNHHFIKLGKMVPHSSTLFVCDIQETFRNLIQFMPSVIHVARKMIRCADIMKIPVIVTEQYPKAFGKTIPEIKELLKPNHYIFEKLKFSMVTEEVEHTLQEKLKPKSIILCGIESHVCIFQTALDLIEKGYEVHVLADGVSSQKSSDRFIALERLRQSGVFVTTSESIIFQLMVTKEYEHFKEILNLLKENKPETGLVVKE